MPVMEDTRAMPLYTRDHRLCAQEVISAHLAGDWPLRDQLVESYCQDSWPMLACFLDFVVAQVAEGSVDTAKPRFADQQWMLGDVVAVVAQHRGVSQEAVAVELVGEDVVQVVCGDPDLQRLVRAAQTTLVSHMVSRRSQQPWGIATNSDELSLAQLTVGANILLWHLCALASAEMEVSQVVLILLPHLKKVLQRGADHYGMTLEKFTSQVWIEHLIRDGSADQT